MNITPEAEAAFIENIEGLDGDKDSAKESLQRFCNSSIIQGLKQRETGETPMRRLLQYSIKHWA